MVITAQDQPFLAYINSGLKRDDPALYRKLVTMRAQLFSTAPASETA